MTQAAMVEEPVVAKIGEACYTTVLDALKNAKDGDTITILKVHTVCLTSPTYISMKTMIRLPRT